MLFNHGYLGGPTPVTIMMTGSLPPDGRGMAEVVSSVVTMCTCMPRVKGHSHATFSTPPCSSTSVARSCIELPLIVKCVCSF